MQEGGDERQSKVVTLTDNLSYRLPAYDVVDLNADVQFDAVSVRLFVKNLTDERALPAAARPLTA